MFLGVAAGPERADKSDRGEAQADPLTPERHRADRPREKNEVGSDDPEQGVLQGMNFQALRLGAEVLQRLLQLGKIGRRKRVHAGESMGADHRPGSVKWAERKLRAGGGGATDRPGGAAAPRAAEGWPRRRARGAKSDGGLCHRAHGARTQRKQETNRPEPERSPRNTRKDLNRRKRRERRTEDGGRGTDFTGGNRENGGCFFIRAIRVIRGERVWKVGRKNAQKAQKSEEDCVTEATELGHRGGRR